MRDYCDSCFKNKIFKMVKYKNKKLKFKHFEHHMETERDGKRERKVI